MNPVTRLSDCLNCKDKYYDLILIIVHGLTKMTYYEPVKIPIEVLELVDIIMNPVL